MSASVSHWRERQTDDQQRQYDAQQTRQRRSHRDTQRYAAEGLSCLLLTDRLSVLHVGLSVLTSIQSRSTVSTAVLRTRHVWHSAVNAPQFSACCDKRRLTDILQSLPDVPQELQQLLSAANERGRQFRSDIRAYNSVLAFNKSIGASLNEGLTTGGVYTFRIGGEMYQRIGSVARSASELTTDIRSVLHHRHRQ